MRRTLTSIVSVHARCSSQSAGTSASNGPVLEAVVDRLRARRPGLAVEHVEVARLPVQRRGGHDPHDLVAVARPRDRPVALLPREAHRVVGAEALGERAVVEPRLAAIGQRGDRQRAQQRHREQPGDAEPGPEREPLQPQEARRSARRARARAAADAAGPAQRDDRRGDDDQQHGQRDDRIAAVRRRQRHARARCAVGVRGQNVSRPARISSWAPSSSSTMPGHGSALTYGSRTVPSACSPVPSPRQQIVPVARLEEVRARRRRASSRRTARRSRPPSSARGAQPALAHALDEQDADGAADRDQHPQQRVPGAEPADEPLPLAARRSTPAR